MTPQALDSLSREELVALVLAFSEQVRTLQARIAELEQQLKGPPKTPRNSSLPPSAGQKENRPERGRKVRKGRPGVARALAEHPDDVREVFAATWASLLLRVHGSVLPRSHPGTPSRAPPISSFPG